MADAKTKYKNAQRALARVKAKNAGLAQKTVQDWLNAGFFVDSAVNADLQQIRRLSISDANTIYSAFSDQEVQTLAAKGLLDPALSAIGDTTGGVAKRVGQLPQETLGAVADGLSVTYDVLKPLFQANIWIRVGEVVLGVVLIAVGVARMTNVVPVATKIAKAVA